MKWGFDFSGSMMVKIIIIRKDEVKSVKM